MIDDLDLPLEWRFQLHFGMSTQPQGFFCKVLKGLTNRVVPSNSLALHAAISGATQSYPQGRVF